MRVSFHYLEYRTVLPSISLRSDILSRTGFIPRHSPYRSSRALVNRTVTSFTSIHTTLWRCHKNRAFCAPLLPACNNSYSYCSFSPSRICKLENPQPCTTIVHTVRLGEHAATPYGCSYIYRTVFILFSCTCMPQPYGTSISSTVRSF